jgi:hypothetical protein
MKRLELAIGELAKVSDAVDREADWSLEEPEQASTPLPRLVCESEISRSNPPVLFGAWRVFFACWPRATYSGGVAQPFSCDSTFRTIRATGLASADCGASLICANVTTPRATTRSAPDAAMRRRYFTETSFLMANQELAKLTGVSHHL